MKFVKGFVITIALYIGLSMLFKILVTYMNAPEDIGTLFASLGSISPIFYQYLANPVIMGVFYGINLYIDDPTDISLLLNILGCIVPVIVAALVGSVAEKKSGSVKYIFLSTFLGLMVAATIGIIFQIVDWPEAPVFVYMNGFPVQQWEKFITGGLIMSALNAFIWCAVGVFITSKGWG
ncbi:MAG: hypothetical protein Q6373_008110 [Candidatus Sigynarchaeota archaeon]